MPSLAYLSSEARRAAWPAPLARSGDVYLPKQFVNRKERKKTKEQKATGAGEGGGGGGGGSRYLPQISIGHHQLRRGGAIKAGPRQRDGYLPAKQ